MRLSERPPADASDDLALVTRCADGDDDAWAEFLRRYGNFLDFMIRRALAGQGGRLPGPDEVADIRDEILAWLLENDGRVMRTYRGESRLTSWIGVVIGRRARRIARRGAGLGAKTVSLDALTPEATSHLAVDARSDQGDARQEALGRLSAALEALPERDRRLLTGAFYEKRSYQDLAEDLDVRPDSIGQLLFRAKQRLKKQLGDLGSLEHLSGLLIALLSLVERR
ncbi:MAG: sigma-70 family RNA polymerase sigma factor [Planctomycetes bacterium]|nr:sigma-70 family RNA polymerase sigma factor [Planctomycetota bacterium]